MSQKNRFKHFKGYQRMLVPIKSFSYVNLKLHLGEIFEESFAGTVLWNCILVSRVLSTETKGNSLTRYLLT